MKQAVRIRIDALRPLLKDADSEVRDAAAKSIERLEGAASIEDILNTLKTGTMSARITAIYALGEIGGSKVIAPLVYCAGRPEEDIRSAAVEVLGRLAFPSTLQVLLDRLEDKNTAIQARAIAALGGFSPTPALHERLRRFLAANDGILEAEAVLALARLKDRDSEESITALLASPHVSTRQAAATALSILPFQ